MHRYTCSTHGTMSLTPGSEVKCQRLEVDRHVGGHTQVQAVPAGVLNNAPVSLVGHRGAELVDGGDHVAQRAVVLSCELIMRILGSSGLEEVNELPLGLRLYSHVVLKLWRLELVPDDQVDRDWLVADPAVVDIVLSQAGGRAGGRDRGA